MMSTPKSARSSSSSSSSSSSGEKIPTKDERRALQARSNSVVKEAQIVAAFYAGIAVHAKSGTDTNTLNSWYLEAFEFAVNTIWKVWTNKTSCEDIPDEQKFAYGFDFNVLSAKKVRLLFGVFSFSNHI